MGSFHQGDQGDPVHAVVCFKRIVGYVNWEESQCSTCGNVKTEQIFNLLEAKLVDEQMRETDQRRISPEAWNEVYRAQKLPVAMKQFFKTQLPEIQFNLASEIRKFKVFWERDFLATISNKQCVLVDLLEAAVLTFIVAFFLLFSESGSRENVACLFRLNENIPPVPFHFCNRFALPRIDRFCGGDRPRLKDPAGRETY